MATKRKILETITRENLLIVAQNLEIGGLTGKSKDEVIDILAGSRGVAIEEVLEMFPRDRLKEMCQKLGLSDYGREKQVLTDRLLGREDAETDDRPKESRMAKRKNNGNDDDATLLPIGDYRHTGAKRKNNPPAKIAAEGVVPVLPKVEYAYSPRRAPQLQFDPTGGPDAIPAMLAEAQRRPLTAAEAKALAEALRTQEPWLEWAGKREKRSFVVDPVALHIHERVSAQAILNVAAREDVEKSLFADPQQEYREAVQFYKHDIDWTNRLILGDSLQVMSSLAQREDLAGKVQMIYIDPPYGIKFASNFQSEIGRRDVKDREQDLTREPEMVKAYRDTWNLGIHSYLAYLRDRLIVARELLADTGSIFVQISDENLHRVRQVLDEVFGPENALRVITVAKTAGLGSDLIPSATDFLLWYARNRATCRINSMFRPKESGEDGGGPYRNTDADGRIFRIDNLTSPNQGVQSCLYRYEMDGREYSTPSSAQWKTTKAGMDRLRQANRLQAGQGLYYRRFLDDFPVKPLNNLWADTGAGGFVEEKWYVVQTNAKIILRCVLMSTAPGDIVLDPTCGSGTTAYVAEQWGRRWIAIDTSRVSLAVARQRLLTAKFDYFKLRQEDRGVAAGFVYKSVPHVTLGSIAQNTYLDPIFAKHAPLLDASLATANIALGKVSAQTRTKLAGKLVAKQSREGKRAITDADRRRWELPERGKKWEHWEVPFDTDPDWPEELREAVTAYRKAWRAKMDAVNACIAANAEQEELMDQPEVVRGITRVSGPFTVEAVQPPEMSLGDPLDGKFGGEPDEAGPTFTIRPVEVRNDLEAKNAEAYLDQMMGLLKLDGVRFPNNKQMTFSRLARIAGGTVLGIHADGRWTPAAQSDDDADGKATVAVSFGPQYGPVTAKQVEEVLRSAARGGYDDLVIAGFSFDGAAQSLIDENPNPKVRMHLAHIRPDVNPGMAGLLKEQPGSQLFTVFGQPRTKIKGPDKDGQYTLTMEGVDIYNPVSNTLAATGADKVAAWFLDGDYDGRTFCITQAFFPDKSAWEKLSKALDGVVDPDRFEALSGTVSLPFPAGKHKRVAVKVIDPRGNEVMQVHRLD